VDLLFIPSMMRPPQGFPPLRRDLDRFMAEIVPAFRLG